MLQKTFPMPRIFVLLWTLSSRYGMSAAVLKSEQMWESTWHSHKTAHSHSLIKEGAHGLHKIFLSSMIDLFCFSCMVVFACYMSVFHFYVCLNIFLFFPLKIIINLRRCFQWTGFFNQLPYQNLDVCSEERAEKKQKHDRYLKEMFYNRPVPSFETIVNNEILT